MPKDQGKFDFSCHDPFKPMTIQLQKQKPNQQKKKKCLLHIVCCGCIQLETKPGLTTLKRISFVAIWRQMVRTLCTLLQKCHCAAQAASLQLLTRWTSFIKPPAQAPSLQPSCTGTSPGSRRWKFPVWCSELGPAVGRLHPRSFYRSPHVCYETQIHVWFHPNTLMFNKPEYKLLTYQ